MADTKVETNPVKVLRLKCKDCTCNQDSEIQNCSIKSCPIWPWRFGRNPYRKAMSEEQKAALRERMLKMKAENRSDEVDEARAELADFITKLKEDKNA